MSRPRTEREELISRAFVTLADTLIDEYDVIDLLDRLAGFCVQLLPADAAGIVLGDARRELRAVAASDEAAHVMELLQLQSDEGPCLDCFQSAAPVSVADLAEAAGRWPTFVAAVAAARRLPLGARPAAAAARAGDRRIEPVPRAVPGPLPELDLALGQALADVATIGILQERAIRRGEVLNEQLQTALNSRVIIEQAKGVLAQYGELAPAVAFERLRHYARSHNLKLADLARRIVDKKFNLAEILQTVNGA